MALTHDATAGCAGTAPAAVTVTAAEAASEMAAALAGFRQAYPTFDTTAALDELRATEYARLDALGQTYLDYTGGTSPRLASTLSTPG
jgi:hypothetical protein